MKELFKEGKHKRYFDADLALDLYETYLVNLDEEMMEELLFQIGVLVDMVCSLDIGPSVGQCNHPILKADAIQLVWIKLVEGKISTYAPSVFMNYLWVLIRNSMISSIRGMTQRFDQWADNRDPTVGTVDSFVGAEAKIYIHQLRSTAFDVFKADIRFGGKERDACIFMAECLFGWRDFDPATAKWRFKLNEKRFGFLMNYVTYLLKNSEYTVKDVDERFIASQ